MHRKRNGFRETKDVYTTDFLILIFHFFLLCLLNDLRKIGYFYFILLFLTCSMQNLKKGLAEVQQ